MFFWVCPCLYVCMCGETNIPIVHNIQRHDTRTLFAGYYFFNCQSPVAITKKKIITKSH